MTTVNIAATSSTQYTLSGAVAGQCGTVHEVNIGFALPTSNTVSYAVEGQSHTATRNADTGSITDTNNNAPQCNGVLTKNAVSTASSSSRLVLLACAFVALVITRW
jgi:hypothetical protein